MRWMVKGWKAVQIFIVMCDGAFDTLTSIDAMIDAHAVHQDTQFYKAAKRAKRNATVVHEATKLLSQRRPEDAEHYLGIDP